MSKLTNYDAGYDEGAWEAFSEATGIGQQPEQKRRAAWWWFGGAGLLMVLGLVIFGSGEKMEVGSGEREVGSGNTSTSLSMTESKLGNKSESSLRGTKQPLARRSQSPVQKQEAQLAIPNHFTQKSNLTKSSKPTELQKKNFILRQLKKRKNRKWGGSCLVPTHGVRDLKRQSIKNKLQTGVNTGWQPTDKLVVVEPIIKSENKEQLVAEIPQPDKVETPEMIKPKVVDSIIPTLVVKKPKTPKQRAYFIDYALHSSNLQMNPVLPVANKVNYLSGRSVGFTFMGGGEIARNTFVATGIGYYKMAVHSLIDRDSTFTTYFANGTYTHLAMDTATGRIGMKSDTVFGSFKQTVNLSNLSTASITLISLPFELQWLGKYGKFSYGYAGGATIMLIANASGNRMIDAYNTQVISKTDLQYRSVVYGTGRLMLGGEFLPGLRVMAGAALFVTPMKYRAVSFSNELSLRLQYIFRRKN